MHYLSYIIECSDLLGLAVPTLRKREKEKAQHPLPVIKDKPPTLDECNTLKSASATPLFVRLLAHRAGPSQPLSWIPTWKCSRVLPASDHTMEYVALC